MTRVRQEFDINMVLQQNQSYQTTSLVHTLANEEISDFGEAVRKVRAKLHQPMGQTEEERLEYTQTLHKAVLGYEKERSKMYSMIQHIIRTDKIQAQLPANSPYKSLEEGIFAETIGMKVLEEFLHRSDVEEIQVVGLDVYLMIGAKEHPTKVKFQSLKDVYSLQSNLVLFTNDRLDLTKPETEVVMVDGSRVTMTIPPLTSEPTITIRRFPLEEFSLDDLVHRRTINAKIKTLLQAIIHGRCTLVLLGDTGSGKTHLQVALISEMPADHRLVTLESDFELFIRQRFPGRNVVSYQLLEELGYDGKRIFKNVLRQTPKRIIQAEIRTEDANEFVKAGTRGHKGSITSAHGNELVDIPELIAEMCMQDGRQVDYLSLVKRIAKRVVDIGIKIEVIGHRRVITEIGEIDLIDEKGAMIRTLCAYDFFREDWVFPEKMSPELGRQIFKFDRSSFYNLVDMGVVDKECLQRFNIPSFS